MSSNLGLEKGDQSGEDLIKEGLDEIKRIENEIVREIITTLNFSNERQLVMYIKKNIPNISDENLIKQLVLYGSEEIQLAFCEGWFFLSEDVQVILASSNFLKVQEFLLEQYPLLKDGTKIALCKSKFKEAQRFIVDNWGLVKAKDIQLMISQSEFVEVQLALCYRLNYQLTEESIAELAKSESQDVLEFIATICLRKKIAIPEPLINSNFINIQKIICNSFLDLDVEFQIKLAQSQFFDIQIFIVDVFWFLLRKEVKIALANSQFQNVQLFILEKTTTPIKEIKEAFLNSKFNSVREKMKELTCESACRKAIINLPED